MLLSRRQLHFLSRDPRMLGRAIAIIAGAFIVSAILIGWLEKPMWFQDQEDPLSAKIKGLTSSSNPDRLQLVRALRDNINESAGEDTLPAVTLRLLLPAGTLPAPEQEAVEGWYTALSTNKVPPDLPGKLQALTMPGAPELPATLAADLKRISRDFKGALADYEAIGARPGGEEARRRAVDLALARGWPEVLERLLAQPAWHEAVYAVDDGLSRIIAEESLDVPVLFQQKLAYTRMLLGKTDYLILSLLTAAVWFVSLHKAARLPHRQWWLGLLGIGLGIFSTVITLVLYSLQEARNGLTDSDLAGPALLFQIASVGLREESAKLICFLPLLLFLRRATPAQAFMAASSVGLGFALKENVGYYLASGGTSVLGRFCTATFMHIGMTGLTGLALFKFLRYPKNYGSLFLATFCGMVLLHGFYNFSQGGFDNPFSRELSNLTVFMIAGLGWFYFQTLRQEQDDAPQNLSATAVFLLGSTIVMGTLLNFHVWQLGWQTALIVFIPAALSAVLMGWLFVHFLRNS